MQTGKPAEGKTVPEVFASRVRLSGNQVALRYKKLGIWHDVTWNQYHQKVKEVCLALISWGLQKGECVSVIGENCPEWVYVDLGVMHAGGTTVGVYATNSWEQCHYVISHSESRFFFVENEEQLDKALRLREKSPRLQKIVVWDLKGLKHFKNPMVMSFEDFLASGQAQEKQDPALFVRHSSQVKPDDLARLIYTSGTTGPPKGAMLTHANLTWMAEAMNEGNPMGKEDEFLSFLPLCQGSINKIESCVSIRNPAKKRKAHRNVVKYAQDHKIQYTTYASLTQHPEVQKLIQKEVDKVNKTLANVETVKKFTILSKKLYEEDGEVTPTLKVKRKYINEAFKDLIEVMYKSD